ncbi:caspase family protein [Streptomyces sp. NPDC021562]|uniref:caspase family protein n=1 Tax=Streptomyces sp. NPDC021562 TaxID=3155121 RepID=UPI0033FD56BE
MTESRHALIIANDRYVDQGLKKLRAPAQDAAALAGVLEDPQIGEFKVQVVHNARADEMRRSIQRFFKDRRRDDTLLLHFSCHGLKSESGELYFAAGDTEPQLLDATAISSQFVRGCMSRTMAGRTVLFLDCCYGGAFSRGASARASGDVNVLESFQTEKEPGGQGWAVITASDSMEYAFEGPELAENSAPRPSVFTHAVVEGLKSGEADRDGDGEVRLMELYDFVYERVREENPNQTPKRTVEMRGDPWLAHSRRGRLKIVAVPSPPALQEAMNSSEVIKRQNTVLLWLKKRLQNPELPIAEGARQHLEEVAHNDIPEVADLASDALSEIHLAPSPDHLDFGLLPNGAPARKKSVTMQGPPLARHCVAQPTQSWLQVDPTPSGLEVHVDTAAEGHLSGDIVLKGVADEALIHVEAVVDPRIEPAPLAGPTDQEPEPRPPGPRTDTTIIQPPTPPPSIPEPPSTPPPGSVPGRKEPRTSRLARALAPAGTALVLAGTAAITAIVAIQAAVSAVYERSKRGVHGNIEDNIHHHGVLASLTVCLITGALALVVGALARHDLRRRRERYTTQAAGITQALTSIAKGLAIPALVLAVLADIAYVVGSRYW